MLNQKDNISPQAKNALRISLIGLIASIVSACVYLVPAIQTGAWQLYAWSAATGILAIASLITISLIRQGRVTAGIWILLTTFNITSIFSVFVIEGIGIPLGIAAAILSVFVATQTLPTKQNNWAIPLSVFGGITIMYLTLYLPAERFTPTSLIRVYLLTVMVILFMVIGYLIAQQFRYYLLRTKLIIVFIVIVFISIGLVAFISDVVLRANLKEEIGSQLYTLARSKGTEIGQAIKRESNSLEALTFNKLVQQTAALSNSTNPLTQDEINQLDIQWRAGLNEELANGVINNELGNELRRFRDEFPQHKEIFLTNRQGVIIATTNRTSDYYQGDEEWWALAFRDGLFIGQPEYDESSDSISVVIASRVRQPRTGETIGVLRTTVALTALKDSLTYGLFGKTGHVDIYLPGGREIQLQPDKNGKLEVVLTEAETDLDQFIRLTKRYLELNLDNVPKIASGYPVRANDDITGDDDLAISNLNWHVVVFQDQDEAFQPIETQTRNNIILTIAISILVGLAAVGVSQLITGPLSRLTTVANQIASGDLSKQASVETSDEIGTLAATFNDMTSQLRDFIDTLEQRVSERTMQLSGRTSQLETIADVARSIANIQEVERLLPTITKLINERFGFYHVGIFLVDASREFAALSATNSEGGQKMLARGHKLKVGEQGIVGNVAFSGLPRIALDVGDDAIFFNNPDLPNTHSEVALPLKFGQEIIGVLDIQSTEPNAFSQDDMNIFTILADQVSVAIQNVRSLEQAQRAVYEAEFATSQLTGIAWKSYADKIRTKGYRYDGIRPEPLKETAKSREEKNALEIPVELRGQMIGRLKLKAPDASRKLTDDELAIIQSTADRVALAIDAARLLDEAQKRAARESLLSDIGSRLSTSFQLDSILRDTVEELGQALSGSTVTFQLVNPNATPRAEAGDDGVNAE